MCDCAHCRVHSRCSQPHRAGRQYRSPPSSIAAVLILVFWPDTKGLALEEIAAIFGDQEELFGDATVATLERLSEGKQEGTG